MRKGGFTSQSETGRMAILVNTSKALPSPVGAALCMLVACTGHELL
jgi:hypothetical protein